MTETTGFVRCADDMVIRCKSKGSVEQTLEHIIPYIEKKLLYFKAFPAGDVSVLS